MPKKSSSFEEHNKTDSSIQNVIEGDGKLVSKVNSVSNVDESAYKSCGLRQSLEYFSTERAINVDRLDQPLFSKEGDVLFTKDLVHGEGLQRSPPKPVSLGSTKQKATTEANHKGCVSQILNKVEADLLLWKLCDYNLSPYHGFSSSSPKVLKSRIEDALVENDIEFTLEDKFSYHCVAVHDFSSIKFTLRVAKLQSPCQKVVGETHVAEFTKCRCSCPLAWQAVFVRLADSLEDVLKFKNRIMQEKRTNSEGVFGEQSSDWSGQFMTSADRGALLSTLLEATSEYQCDDDVAELASVIACFSNDYEGKHEESLEVSDVQKLLSLLNHQSTDVRTSICTVIRNVARAGLFNALGEEDKEDIIRCLTRCVQAIGPKETFTNRLKREAVEALGVMQGVFPLKDTGTRDMARKTIQACATSCDFRLSACAKEALSSFRKEDISTG